MVFLNGILQLHDLIAELGIDPERIDPREA
jgi:hypothetical protein